MLADMGVFCRSSEKAYHAYRGKDPHVEAQGAAEGIACRGPDEEYGSDDPPLPPKLRVMAVKSIFRIKAPPGMIPPSSASLNGFQAEPEIARRERRGEDDKHEAAREAFQGPHIPHRDD